MNELCSWRIFAFESIFTNIHYIDIYIVNMCKIHANGYTITVARFNICRVVWFYTWEADVDSFEWIWRYSQASVHFYIYLYRYGVGIYVTYPSWFWTHSSHPESLHKPLMLPSRYALQQVQCYAHIKYWIMSLLWITGSSKRFGAYRYKDLSSKKLQFSYFLSLRPFYAFAKLFDSPLKKSHILDILNLYSHDRYCVQWETSSYFVVRDPRN